MRYKECKCEKKKMRGGWRYKWEENFERWLQDATARQIHFKDKINVAILRPPVAE